jgi:hypothetical protein
MTGDMPESIRMALPSLSQSPPLLPQFHRNSFRKMQVRGAENGHNKSVKAVSTHNLRGTVRVMTESGPPHSLTSVTSKDDRKTSS